MDLIPLDQDRDPWRNIVTRVMMTLRVVQNVGIFFSP
jgi:hypothetical protein